MPTRIDRAMPLVALCTLAAVLASVVIVSNNKIAAAPTVDPEARKVIEAAGRYVQALQSFSITINVRIDIGVLGQKNTLKISQKLQAERPNKLAFTLDSTAGQGTVVCDGKKLSLYAAGLEKYLVLDAPATWDAILQNQLVPNILSPGDAQAVTLALLSDDPAAKLLAGVETLRYGGLVDLDGVKCHVIEATGKELNGKLWIDAGDKPLVRQFEPDMQHLVAQLSPPGKDPGGAELVKVTNVVRFGEWQVNPKFAPDTFVFAAPEGIPKASSLAELLAGEAGVLLGKPAPAVKLALLGGGKLDLGALAKKNIVVLDFWATWCGPCQEAMPIIEKVTANFKDKGVLLYAVNVGEPAAEVGKFIADSGLHMNVALDEDTAVARAYKANSIPLSVLVGKDGTVQAVHVGLSPDLEKELTKELEALTTGKKLVADAEPEKAKPDSAKE